MSQSKVRSARDSILGVRPIPNDPISTERERLKKAAEHAKLFEKTALQFTEHASSLASVNDELVQSLMGVIEPDMILPLSSIRDGHVESKPKLEAFRMQMRGFIEKAKLCEESFIDRDKKYWEKEHYEDKINKLTDDEKLNAELVDRNVKKRSKAITEYAETEKTLREATVLSNSLHDIVDSGASMYQEYLCELFGKSCFTTHESSEALDGGNEPFTESSSFYPRIESEAE